MSNSPRILILFSSGEIGGAERSLVRMAAYRREGRPSYFIGTLGGNGNLRPFIEDCGFKAHLFGDKKSVFGLRAIINLILFVHREKIDTLYICGLRASIVLRLLRFLYPKTKIVHGIRSSPGSRSALDCAIRMTEFFLAPLTNLYITNSKRAAEILEHSCSVPQNKLVTIYNGLENLPAPEILPPIQSRPQHVVTIANMAPRKGHIEFLDIIQNVLQSRPDIKFYFVGRDDSNGAVQQRIDQLGLTNSVICTGYVENPIPYLSQARLMALPSLWSEGCPTSILESFSCQTPVVAYGIDGIPELISNGVDGFCVTPFLKKEMARSILVLLDHQDLCTSMGKAGRQKIETSFELRHCALSHDQHLRELYK